MCRPEPRRHVRARGLGAPGAGFLPVPHCDLERRGQTSPCLAGRLPPPSAPLRHTWARAARRSVPSPAATFPPHLRTGDRGNAPRRWGQFEPRSLVWLARPSVSATRLRSSPEPPTLGLASLLFSPFPRTGRSKDPFLVPLVPSTPPAHQPPLRAPHAAPCSSLASLSCAAGRRAQPGPRAGSACPAPVQLLSPSAPSVDWATRPASRPTHETSLPASSPTALTTECPPCPSTFPFRKRRACPRTGRRPCRLRPSLLSRAGIPHQGLHHPRNVRVFSPRLWLAGAPGHRACVRTPAARLPAPSPKAGPASAPPSGTARPRR